MGRRKTTTGSILGSPGSLLGRRGWVATSGWPPVAAWPPLGLQAPNAPPPFYDSRRQPAFTRPGDEGAAEVAPRGGSRAPPADDAAARPRHPAHQALRPDEKRAPRRPRRTHKLACGKRPFMRLNPPNHHQEPVLHQGSHFADLLDAGRMPSWQRCRLGAAWASWSAAQLVTGPAVGHH